MMREGVTLNLERMQKDARGQVLDLDIAPAKSVWTQRRKFHGV